VGAPAAGELVQSTGAEEVQPVLLAQVLLEGVMSIKILEEEAVAVATVVHSVVTVNIMEVVVVAKGLPMVEVATEPLMFHPLRQEYRALVEEEAVDSPLMDMMTGRPEQLEIVGPVVLE
jgi:hypothetical protein